MLVVNAIRYWFFRLLSSVNRGFGTFVSSASHVVSLFFEIYFANKRNNAKLTVGLELLTIRKINYATCVSAERDVHYKYIAAEQTARPRHRRSIDRIYKTQAGEYGIPLADGKKRKLFFSLAIIVLYLNNFSWKRYIRFLSFSSACRVNNLKYVIRYTYSNNWKLEKKIDETLWIFLSKLEIFWKNR